MKKVAFVIGLCAAALVCAGAEARAQGGASRGPDPATMRDADMEKDSLHNLEVARQYFKLKKAYFASLQRAEEIVAGNPNFARIDEALYYAGMSNFYLSRNQGKQKVESIPEKRRMTPEKYREEARNYLSQLVNDHPDSDFNKQVQDALRELGGPIPKQ